MEPNNAAHIIIAATKVEGGSIRMEEILGLPIPPVDYWWPGAIHEGNGVRRTIVDEQASKEQRAALIALDSGQHGGPYWKVFAAVCHNLIEALFAPITVNVDREKRCATIRIPGIAKSDIEPSKILLPARSTGPHRVAQWFRIQGSRDG